MQKKERKNERTNKRTNERTGENEMPMPNHNRENVGQTTKLNSGLALIAGDDRMINNIAGGTGKFEVSGSIYPENYRDSPGKLRAATRSAGDGTARERIFERASPKTPIYYRGNCAGDGMTFLRGSRPECIPQEMDEARGTDGGFVSRDYGFLILNVEN